MNFKITARVVSQLGAELISSDEIAIYELVKNGFDAGSCVIEVNVSFKIELGLIEGIMALVRVQATGSQVAEPDTKRFIADALRNRGVFKRSYHCILPENEVASLADIYNQSDPKPFWNALAQANSIDIVDYGTGMTADEVERYFLTIGTTHRLEEVEDIQRNNPGGLVPFGEKGIGRLSVMRLGNMFSMFTVPERDERCTMLTINWRKFYDSRDKDLSSIPIESEHPVKGHAKSGTIITISDLLSDWSRQKAIELGTNHLAKFIDPFPEHVQKGDDNATSKRRSVILRWNGELIQFAEAIHTYLENAPNSMKFRGEISPDGIFEMNTEIQFGATTTKGSETIKRIYSAVDFSGITNEDLCALGPFEFQLYHYPRNRLKAIPQVATRGELKAWLDRWCGGLMVFRDGVRVLPYGLPSDDWLKLDDKALRGKGFRVNRIQVVGCVRISRLANPQLIDQTNREGLRTNEVFRTFQKVVQRMVQNVFVPLLDHHLGSDNPEPTYLASELQKRSDALTSSVEELESAIKVQDWRVVTEVRKNINNAAQGVSELHEAVETLLREKEGNRLEIIELAATGMNAEAMAHDLEGLIESAIASLDQLAKSTGPTIAGAVRHIRAVHKSLLVQVKQLAPGPAKARRRASTFSVVELLEDLRSFYSEKCRRHDIEIRLESKGSSDFKIKAVNGHIRQIFDNLIRNSIFWLQDTATKYPEMEKLITIVIDPISRSVQVCDSGVGISRDDSEWVFRPFNSRRESGRGLGLYICRELSEFNNVQLQLDANTPNSFGRLNKFSIEFS